MRLLTFLFIGLFTFTIPVFGQSITFDPPVLDFGIVNVGDFKTLTLKIKNNGPDSNLFFVDDDFIGFTQPVYSTAFSGNEILLPGKELVVSIMFRPDDNIRYDGQMVICMETGANEGCIAAPLTGGGRLSNAYYNNTYNLWDRVLMDTLKSILARNYISLGYTAARDQMYGDIDNDGGTVTCVYTGRQAQFSTRAGAVQNNFNTEHTWPQSMFSSQEPMQSDIFHLFPTDETANSTRSNFPFGIVPDPTWQAGGSRGKSGLFEPRDAQKGNTARAMLYMGVRYGNFRDFLTGQEAMLRDWAFTFPPTPADTVRNRKIFLLQRNRNPFIDHPQFLNRIFTISTFAERPAERKIWMPKLPSLNFEFMLPGLTESYDIVIANNGRNEISYFAALPASQWFSISPEQGVIAPGGFATLTLKANAVASNQKFESKLELVINEWPNDTTITIPLVANVLLDSRSVGETMLSKIAAFPNPFSERISLSGEILPGTTLTITNTTGQVLSAYTLEGNTDIDAKALQAGFYILKLQYGSETRFLKAVKQ